MMLCDFSLFYLLNIQRAEYTLNATSSSDISSNGEVDVNGNDDEIDIDDKDNKEDGDKEQHDHHIDYGEVWIYFKKFWKYLFVLFVCPYHICWLYSCFISYFVTNWFLVLIGLCFWEALLIVKSLYLFS